MKYNYPVACEYLGRARDAERNVQRMRERLINLRMLLTDTSVHLTDMPHSDSPDLQKHETLHAEIDALEREIAAAEKTVVAVRTDIGITISRMSDPISQRIMILYYLQNMSWQEAAQEIRYSKAQTFRYRDEGYAELEKMLKAA